MGKYRGPYPNIVGKTIHPKIPNWRRGDKRRHCETLEKERKAERKTDQELKRRFTKSGKRVDSMLKGVAA